MIRFLSYSFAFGISLSLCFGQEIKIAEDAANMDVEEEGTLMVQPENEMTIAPEVYQEYKASEWISFRPGVRIRPSNSGWFSAQVSEISETREELLTKILEMKVFPNPMVGEVVEISLTIKPELPWHAQLFSLDGRKIEGFEEVAIEGSEAQIDLQGLPKGIYLLKATIAEKVITRKLVKQ